MNAEQLIDQLCESGSWRPIGRIAVKYKGDEYFTYPNDPKTTYLFPNQALADRFYDEVSRKFPGMSVTKDYTKPPYFLVDVLP